MAHLLLTTLMLGMGSWLCEPPATPKPNILFIMMDDLGYGQLGIYNDTLETSDFPPLFVQFVDSTQGYSHKHALEFSRTAIPTLTDLAKQGVIFTKAYVSSSLCAPSRIGIATGVLQNRFGVYSNGDGEAGGFPPGSLLAEHFQELGYQTAHIGKWHIGSRNKEMLTETLNRHQLPEGTAYHDLALTHPEIYREIEESGYYGSVVDSQHPLNNGFDYYFGYNTWASQFYHSTLVWENFEHAGKQKGYNTDVFTDKALDFIQKSQTNGSPFFLQLHYHAIHDSLEPKAPDPYLAPFQSSSFELNNFYAHIHGVDQNIKRIVDYLQSQELLKNTLLIFTSDNGAMSAGKHKGHKTGSPLPGNAPFAGHKGNLYQGGIRVPLFVYWPECITTSHRSDHLVSTLDILPTAIDAAGGIVPDKIDGKSLLPLLRDPSASAVHDYLFWAGVHSTAWGYLIEKTTKDHITERPFAPPAWVVIQDEYLLRLTGTLPPGIYHDFMQGRKPVKELYHIGRDPMETQDLSLQMPDKVAQLTQLFSDEFQSLPPPITWERGKWEELFKTHK